jgi:hypothetical protein
MNCLALAFAAVLAVQTPQDPETDRLRKEVEKLKADNAVALRQLEVFMAQIQELNDRLARAQKGKKPAAGAGAGDALDDLLATDRKAVEEKQAEREQERLKSAALALAVPAPVPVIPGRNSLPEGKITAVAHELDLVVISVGSEDGVAEGQTYAITRGEQTIATLKIDRVDRKWAAGKVSKKTSEPRVGDSVGQPKVTASYKVPFTPVTPGSAVLSSADELRAIRKELDEVRSQVRQLSDRIVPSWQGAGVSVEEAPAELRTHLAILRGLLVRRVREGSPAEKAGLKVNDVVPDLLEAQLLEAIENGMPIHVVRQGQRVRLTGAKGR